MYTHHPITVKVNFCPISGSLYLIIKIYFFFLIQNRLELVIDSRFDLKLTFVASSRTIVLSGNAGLPQGPLVHITGMDWIRLEEDQYCESKRLLFSCFRSPTDHLLFKRVYYFLFVWLPKHLIFSRLWFIQNHYRTPINQLP